MALCEVAQRGQPTSVDCRLNCPSDSHRHHRLRVLPAATNRLDHWTHIARVQERLGDFSIAAMRLYDRRGSKVVASPGFNVTYQRWQSACVHWRTGETSRSPPIPANRTMTTVPKTTSVLPECVQIPASRTGAAAFERTAGADSSPFSSA